MALIGWTKICKCKADFQHPNGLGKRVDCVAVDHYALECPQEPFPRTLAVALYGDVASERYGMKEWVPSASQIGACPIERALLVQTDHVQDPLEPRFMLRGVMAHDSMSRRIKEFDAKEDWISEKSMVMEVERKSEPFSIYGTLDLYYKPEKKIIDLKTQAEYSVRKKGKQTDKEVINDPKVGRFTRANMNQINAYAVMAKETLDLDVDKLELQYFNGQMEFRRLPVKMIEHKRMKKAFVTSMTNLYDAVWGFRELSSFKPVPESPDVFPYNKSPVYYLYKKYFNE